MTRRAHQISREREKLTQLRRGLLVVGISAGGMALNWATIDTRELPWAVEEAIDVLMMLPILGLWGGLVEAVEAWVNRRRERISVTRAMAITSAVLISVAFFIMWLHGPHAPDWW